MKRFKKPILLLVNFLLIAVGVGLLYFAKLSSDAEEPLRDRLDHMTPLQLSSATRDEIQNLHDIAKGIRVGGTFAGVVVIVAGVLNLLALGTRTPRF